MAKRPRLASLSPLLLDASTPLDDHPLQEGLRTARQIVDGNGAVETAVGLPERVLDGLAEALSEREAFAPLHAMESSTDAAVARAGRIGLDRLRRKGVSEPPTGASVEAMPRTLSPQAEGLLTRVDAAGEQVGFLALPASGGVDLFQAIFSDDGGLIALDRYEASRKGWRDQRKALLDDVSLGMTVVPAAYVHLRIEEEQARSSAMGRGTASGFADLRLACGAVAPGTAEAMRAALPAPRALTIESKQALARHTLVAMLAPSVDALRSLVLRLMEIDESVLEVSPAQKKDAVDQAYEKTLTDWLTPTAVLRLARHLREAAYLAVLRDERDLAAELRTQAEEMEAPGHDARADAFLKARLDVRLPRPDLSNPGERPDRVKGSETPSGLIVP
jgi:hypothetical protein